MSNWLITGRSYLFQKDPAKGTIPENDRRVTFLSRRLKLITGITADNIQDYLGKKNGGGTDCKQLTLERHKSFNFTRPLVSLISGVWNSDENKNWQNSSYLLITGHSHIALKSTVTPHRGRVGWRWVFLPAGVIQSLLESQIVTLAEEGFQSHHSYSCPACDLQLILKTDKYMVWGVSFLSPLLRWDNWREK